MSNSSTTSRVSSRGLVSSAVIASVFAGGVWIQSASAAAVRFDNPAGPGHFGWSVSVGYQHLDITLGAASQPGTPGGFSVFELSDEGFGPRVRNLTAGAGLTTYYNGIAYFLTGINAGVTIDGGLDFFNVGYSYLTYTGYEGSYLADGAQTYLGVKFNPGDGIHFGWIGVVRTGLELDAFAWGYETEAGVGILAGAGNVPAPGGVALLAVAAVARRRRRRE